MAPGRKDRQKHYTRRRGDPAVKVGAAPVKPSDEPGKKSSSPSHLRFKHVANYIGVVVFLLIGFVSFTVVMVLTIPVLAAELDFSGWKHKAFSIYTLVANVGYFGLARYTDTSLRTAKTDANMNSSDQRSPSPSVPFRAHVCRLCKALILKHDHHCFIVGRCIGYRNQKYFIWLCGYTALAAFYCLFQTVLYLSVVYHVQFFGAWTYFLLLPRAAAFWYIGLVGYMELALTAYLYVCLGGGLIALGFFLWGLYVAVMGLTTHEAIHGQRRKLKRKSSLSHNWVDVFGKYWYVGMFLPLPLPQYGDGLYSYAGK